MSIAIKTKDCKACGIKFDIFQEDLDFYKRLAPVIAGIKYDLPVPDICPTCRQQQRCSFRNRRNLYKRKCDLTGKDVISMYSPDKPYKIYNNADYESQVEATDYGRDFDFSSSFFEQMKGLQIDVPRFHSAVVIESMNNADYVNGAHGVTNGYLSFSVTECEDVYYCEGIYHSKNCFDCYHVYNCEMSYDCLESSKLYKSISSSYCNDGSDLYFCSHCDGCKDCFCCTNLINKQYCILNKQYTKAQYTEIISKYKLTNKNISKFKKELFNLEREYPVKFARFVNVENSVGDDLMNAKNCYHCFGSKNTEDLRYCYFMNDAKDCMDMLCFGSHLDNAYWSVSIGMSSSNIYFCLECRDNVSNLFYCDSCASNVKNCFGCIGLKNKQYCILNKQYTKQEYEEILPKIIDHMKSTGERGRYFPTSYSAFGYNESLANEHFPLENKQEVISKGFNRMDKEYNIDIPEGIEMLDSDKVTDDIEKVDDSVLLKAILCSQTKKPYRIIKPELDYYRKMGISLPTLHYNQRHKNRFNSVNKKYIHTGNCRKCNIDFKTTYSPNSERILYCKDCYDKEVY